MKLRPSLAVCCCVVLPLAGLTATARADAPPSAPAACPAGSSCVQPTTAGTSTAAIDVDSGENGTMVSEMVVIFGFLGIVWSVPYLVLRRRKQAK